MTTLKVGASLVLASAADGDLGVVIIEAISEDEIVRGRLSISTQTPDRCMTIVEIRNLAGAADDLSFAVMAVHERQLRDLGLMLKEPTSGDVLILWRDFRGLFFSPSLDTMSFFLGRTWS